MAASLRLMEEQNAFAAEEKNRRHEDRAKQIQEEMDDRNMQSNTSDYTPMSKAYFDRKKKENYGPTRVVNIRLYSYNGR